MEFFMIRREMLNDLGLMIFLPADIPRKAPRVMSEGISWSTMLELGRKLAAMA